MIGIYKITSPSSKVYIGQSTDIEYRFKRYKRLHCKSQTAIYNSLLSHGVENHVFEIIEECEISELNDKERYYQDLFDCLKNGLNCRLTTSKNKSGKQSESTKLKIKQSLTGRKRCPSIGRKTAEGLRGRKLSKETKIKLSENNARFNLGKNLSEHTKLMISKNNGNKSSVINTSTNNVYSSIKEASEKENISYCYLRKMLCGKHPNTTNLKYYKK